MVKYPVRKGFKRIGEHKFYARSSKLPHVVPVYCNIARGEYLLVYAEQDYLGTDLASLKQQVAKDAERELHFVTMLEWIGPIDMFGDVRFAFRVVQIAFDDNKQPLRERTVDVDIDGNATTRPNIGDRPVSVRMAHRAAFTKTRYFKLVHVRDVVQQMRNKLVHLVPADADAGDVLDSFETPINIGIPETAP